MESTCSCFCLLIFFAIITLNSKAYTVSDSSEVACNASNEGDIQLVGGRDMYEGRVEVCHHGQWKTVCDRKWGTEEAQVVCRQLGYPNASKVNGFVNTTASHVRRGCAGQGSGKMLQVEWDCNGAESRLLNCSVKENTRDCTDHKMDAGVYCSGQSEDDCDRRSLRLANGPNNASGRVEVCRFGCWGTVCDDGWDRDDANVACQQLGFETDRAIPTRGAYFGEGRVDRPILMSQVKCDQGSKNVTELLNCMSSGIDHQCLHDQDAGVICHGMSMCRDGNIRLVGGETDREGIVEMCYNEVWGTVCADGWNRIAANIVCTQLGYEYSDGVSVQAYAYGSPPSMFRHRLQNTPMLFHNVNCSEAHSMFLQCVDLHTIGVYNCGGNATAGVSCPSKSSSSSSNIHTVILGSVGTTAAVVTGLIVIVTITLILKMKKRRNSGSSAINDVNVPMKENEAYGTVHVTHHLETLSNEAYGTL